jgi:hypothetical protein
MAMPSQILLRIIAGSPRGRANQWLRRKSRCGRRPRDGARAPGAAQHFDWKGGPLQHRPTHWTARCRSAQII